LQAIDRAKPPHHESESPFLFSPEESEKRGYRRFWTVQWLGGPEEWSNNLACGISMYSVENEKPGRPEVLISELENGNGWYFELPGGLAIGFTDDKNEI
jgi:hypothetical protein